jgi:hypothetical protein
MPKKIWFIAGALMLGLAACSGGNGVVGPTPTPGPTPLNPATQTTITAKYAGTLLSNQPIIEYANAGTAANPFPGAVIATQNTGTSGTTLGTTIFTSLTPGTVYCWQYVYMPGPPPATVTATVCTNSWAVGLTLGS